MKRVVVVLVDGMRPEAIAACASPDADWLLARSSYNLNTQTVFPSVTLPCHMSLFHSVDPSRHGVTTNTFTPQVRPVTGLCEQLRKYNKKSAFFWSWGELKDLFQPDSLAYACYLSGHVYTYQTATKELYQQAVGYLKKDQPDFTFFYIGTTDEDGHAHGWMGEQYLNSIREAFRISRGIIEALLQDYVTIVTADHGGHERMHGTREEADMTIPLILQGLGTGVNLDGSTILDIAPTVAKLLEVPSDTDWEGHALV